MNVATMIKTLELFDPHDQVVLDDGCGSYIENFEIRKSPEVMCLVEIGNFEDED